MTRSLSNDEALIVKWGKRAGVTFLIKKHRDIYAGVLKLLL